MKSISEPSEGRGGVRRIVHVTPTWFDASSVIGGGERYVDELARAQAQMAPDLRVEVISFGKRKDNLSRRGVHYRIYKRRTWRHFTELNPFCLRHSLGIIGSTVVHVHQLCTFVSDISAAVAKIMRIPVFGTDHGGGGAWVLNRRLPTDRAYRRVIGQSLIAEEILRPRFPDKTCLIQGGIDLARFCPDPSAERRREVLFVGRLLPHKGVDTLIDAFRIWKPTGWKLRIVGRATDHRYQESLIARAGSLPVLFESNCDDALLVKRYQRAAITVIPSKTIANSALPELMGFTTLESQACGTPVICSDVGPMREFIAEGNSGWVFRAGDAESLAAVLAKAEARITFGDRGISERVRDAVVPYSWENVADAHLRLYGVR